MKSRCTDILGLMYRCTVYARATTSESARQKHHLGLDSDSSLNFVRKCHKSPASPGFCQEGDRRRLSRRAGICKTCAAGSIEGHRENRVEETKQRKEEHIRVRQQVFQHKTGHLGQHQTPCTTAAVTVDIHRTWPKVCAEQWTKRAQPRPQKSSQSSHLLAAQQATACSSRRHRQTLIDESIPQTTNQH